MQRTMAELEECLEEAVWGTQVVARRWGIDVRDLLARTPEWCAAARALLPSPLPGNASLAGGCRAGLLLFTCVVACRPECMATARQPAHFLRQAERMTAPSWDFRLHSSFLVFL